MNSSVEKIPHESKLKTDFTREWQRDYYKKLIAEYIAIRGQHTLPELLSTKDNSLLPILRAVFAKLEQIFAFAREKKVSPEDLIEVRTMELKNWGESHGFKIDFDNPVIDENLITFHGEDLVERLSFLFDIYESGLIVIRSEDDQIQTFNLSFKQNVWLPDNLRVEAFCNLEQAKIKQLPSGLKVMGNMNLNYCFLLTGLPADLVVGNFGSVRIEGCRQEVVDQAKALKDANQITGVVISSYGDYDGSKT